MREKDGDTWYCYYAVMKLHWDPERFANLSPQARALMYVFIQERLHEEDKQRKKLQSSSRSKRR